MSVLTKWMSPLPPVTVGVWTGRVAWGCCSSVGWCHKLFFQFLGNGEGMRIVTSSIGCRDRSLCCRCVNLLDPLNGRGVTWDRGKELKSICHWTAPWRSFSLGIRTISACLLNSKNRYRDVLTYLSKCTKMEADCHCGWGRGLPEQGLTVWRRPSTQPGGSGVRWAEREVRKSKWLWEWLVISTAKNKKVGGQVWFFSRGRSGPCLCYCLEWRQPSECLCGTKPQPYVVSAVWRLPPSAHGFWETIGAICWKVREGTRNKWSWKEKSHKLDFPSNPGELG